MGRDYFALIGESILALGFLDTGFLTTQASEVVDA